MGKSRVNITLPSESVTFFRSQPRDTTLSALFSAALQNYLKAESPAAVSAREKAAILEKEIRQLENRLALARRALREHHAKTGYGYLLPLS